METSPDDGKNWLHWISKIHFRRIITGNRLIPEVDGFRFVAIFIVIASHIYLQCSIPTATSALGKLVYFTFQDGKIGVYLFFTISGFILALPFARHHLFGDKPVLLGKYFKRRLTRLEPPYILALLLRFPLVAAFKQVSLSVVAMHLLASLLYLHNIIYNQYSTINPPAWSLEIEVQFYVLAPAFAVIYLVRQNRLRQFLLTFIILAAGIVTSIWVVPNHRPALTLLNFSQYFLAGFLLCEIYLTNKHPRLPKWTWDILGLASLIFILLARNNWGYFIVLPFVTILFYMAGFHGRFLRAFFANPFISIVGGMCYSLYLTHTIVLTGINMIVQRLQIVRHFGALSGPLIFLCSMVSALIVGGIYFQIIERPCMDPNWPQKLMLKFKGLISRTEQAA